MAESATNHYFKVILRSKIMDKQGSPNKIQFIGNEDISLVAKLFPYSLPLQALASKSLKDLNKLDHDKFLRLSSIISPDRNWLYNYINYPDQKASKIDKSADLKEINPKENIQVISVSTQIPEKKAEIIEYAINIEQETVLIDDYQHTNDLQEDSLVSESLKTSVIETDTAIKKEDDTKEVFLKIHDSQLEKEILKVAIDKSIQQEVSEINVFDDKPLEETQSTNKVVEPEGFNFWLNPTKVKVQSREEKLKKIDALIEKFIKTEPKIVPKKVEFYSPVNIAKQSVEFNEDLVSEPLAAIFEKQGYFDKAMKAYEKLSLKYPEKRAYFATRIEKIQEIIKNIKNNK